MKTLRRLALLLLVWLADFFSNGIHAQQGKSMHVGKILYDAKDQALTIIKQLYCGQAY